LAFQRTVANDGSAGPRRNLDSPICRAELREIYRASPGLSRLAGLSQNALRIVDPQAPASERIVKGDAFTDHAVRTAKLEEYQVVLFATHGMERPDFECFESSLLTTAPPAATGARFQPIDERDGDGVLDSVEVQRLALNADLVILAACETAGAAGLTSGRVLDETLRARQQSRTGLSGGGVVSVLGTSFMAAGARSLIATNWLAQLDATDQLLTTFFTSTKAGRPMDESMQTAQQALMKTSQYSNPVFWGAFSFIGDGARQLNSRPAS
jgi:CHAT domain-containing protein